MTESFPDTLPANLEAEQAILGIVLFDNAVLERVDGLEPQHFAEPFHGRLWAAISGHIRKGQAAKPELIADEFAGDPSYIEFRERAFFVDLIVNAPPAPLAPDYARAIMDCALRRDLIRVGQEALAAAYQFDRPAREHMEAVEGALFALGEGNVQGGGFAPFSDALDGFLAATRAAMSHKGEVAGISTNLIDLDQKVGGLHPSDLVIIAGRPGMGKTALVTNIAYYAARRFRARTDAEGNEEIIDGARVGFYSLEMSAEQLAARVISDIVGIPSNRFRSGDISIEEMRRVEEVAREIRDIPLHIDDGGATSIAKISARARRLKRTRGLDLVVVDYLQLSSGTDKSRGQGRVNEVSEITGGLKALAKDLGVPVIALSQLSRKVEERDDKRPQLSDLRESGSIEQDADQVWFVYREEYYIGRAEPREGTPEHLTWQGEMSRCEGQAEIIIGKQRHGPIGTVNVAFNGETTRFGNLARESHFAAGRQPYGGDA